MLERKHTGNDVGSVCESRTNVAGGLDSSVACKRKTFG